VLSWNNYPSLRVKVRLSNSTCYTCSKLKGDSLIPFAEAISMESVASKHLKNNYYRSSLFDAGSWVE